MFLLLGPNRTNSIVRPSIIAPIEYPPLSITTSLVVPNPLPVSFNAHTLHTRLIQFTPSDALNPTQVSRLRAPFAAECERLHDGDLRRLRGLVHQHRLKAVLHALKDSPSGGGERREDHVRLVDERQLEVVACL